MHYAFIDYCTGTNIFVMLLATRSDAGHVPGLMHPRIGGLWEIECSTRLVPEPGVVSTDRGVRCDRTWPVRRNTGIKE